MLITSEELTIELAIEKLAWVISLRGIGPELAKRCDDKSSILFVINIYFKNYILITFNN